MQLRYKSGRTGDQYVKARGWLDASLSRCPNHPRGGCSLSRHGTYPRKTPRGTRIARWYCPDSHRTFSLLPDCFAARLPGTLVDLEAVVAVAERSGSLAEAANAVRRDAIHLPGAMRWVRRRVRLTHRVLRVVLGLWPDRLAGCAATVGALRVCLETETVLAVLRDRCAGQLQRLPAPLGFYPHGQGEWNPPPARQHKMGPDPPGEAA